MNKFTRRSCGILAGVATLIAGLGGVSAANADDSVTKDSVITSFTNNGSITLNGNVNGEDVDLSQGSFTAVPLAYYSSATISGTSPDQSIKSYDVTTVKSAKDAVNAALAAASLGQSGDDKADTANPMQWVVKNLQSSDNPKYSGSIRTFLDQLAKQNGFKANDDGSALAGTAFQPVTGHADQLQATDLTPGVYAIVNTKAPADKTSGGTKTTYTTAIIAMTGTDINGIKKLGDKAGFLGTVDYKGYGNPTVTKKSLGNADDTHVTQDCTTDSTTDSTTHKTTCNTNSVAGEIGSVLKFELDATIPNTTGYETYKFDLKDQPSTGLTFNNDKNIKITVGGHELVKDTDYTVSQDQDTKQVTFSLGNGNIVGKTYKDDQGNDQNLFPVDAAVVVTYTMTLNDGAVTTTDPITNTATIEYSNNPTTTGTGTTPSTETKVYTGEVNVQKTDMNGKLISGAKFQLFEKNSNTPLKLVALPTAGEYRLALSSDTTTVDDGKMIVPASGKLVIKGLNGVYTLKESDPAPGYTSAGLPSTDITVNVAQKDGGTTEHPVSAGDVTVTATEDSNHLVSFTENGNLVSVKNARNITDMPKTGAIWLTIWVAAALLCAAGGFVLLHSRRKANAR